ncbi:integrase core domain-containing protein [Pirellulales bacterium]|nr:integrase core domain-containing protein [Pirellulales bacterium]
MKFILQPWQLFLLILAGWINRQQRQRIDYLETEVAVLKEHIGKKRILLNDDQRRRLAVKGKVLGRKQLEQFGTLFTPDTILRWHRQLVANKWDYSDRKEKKPGRPRVRQVIVDLILQFAKENPTWGFDRIQGELAKVGYRISDATVSNILKAHGIEPAPTRKRTGSWGTFLKAHWDVMAAIDFTTVEVWTKSGLVTFYLLFVMELKTRRVHFAGCTTSPHEFWMKQMARELTNCEDGFLNGKRYLIMDRDAKFCESFRSFLSDEGVKPVRLPPRAPNMNAHLERFFGSLKYECLRRLILFGEKSARNAVRQYLEHYHTERCHQGLGNKLIVPLERPPDVNTEIKTTERLGGLLRSYRRAA